MKPTEARKRATKKYHDSLDEVKIRVPKGYKKNIQDHATSQGESMTIFIRRAISEAIDRDNQDKTSPTE